MPYEIPQNLKYEEKIAFNLSFVKLFWLALFLGTTGVVFLKTSLLFELKVLVGIVLVLLGVGFAFFGFWGHVKSLIAFKKSVREAGFFDKKLNRFIEVKKVDGDVIFLSNGSLRAVVEVVPINFLILSLEEQEAIVSAFRDFLNSLDFPIQIVMRTTNLSLDDYLFDLKEKVLKLDSKELDEQFDSFKEFVEGFIQDNNVQNRKFYVVVPFEPNHKINFVKDVVIRVKNFFRREKEKTSLELNRETALNQLSVRVKLCQEKLKACGLLNHRLDEEQLVSLLASFFESFIEAQNNYFSPITLLQRFEVEKNE